MFKGSYVALITPFRNGKIDEKKIRELVEWHIEQGTSGFVPMGTTGEAATLDYVEHIRVIELVVKAARGRVPVIGGAGSNSTAEAIDLTRKAKNVGSDAVLLVSPYYNKPTQEGIKAHFLAIAKAVDIPIILYNIPSRTGVTMQPTTIAAMAKASKRIVAVKESTGSMDMTSEIRIACGPSFGILSGDDSLTLPLMAIGASGVISVAANLVPKDVALLCDLCLEERFDEAEAIHRKLYPLVKSLFIETNPGPVKAAMKEAGLIRSDNMRLPMVGVSADTRAKIKLAMKQYGIKK